MKLFHFRIWREMISVCSGGFRPPSYVAAGFTPGISAPARLAGFGREARRLLSGRPPFDLSPQAPAWGRSRSAIFSLPEGFRRSWPGSPTIPVGALTLRSEPPGSGLGASAARHWRETRRRGVPRVSRRLRPDDLGREARRFLSGRSRFDLSPQAPAWGRPRPAIAGKPEGQACSPWRKFTPHSLLGLTDRRDPPRGSQRNLSRAKSRELRQLRQRPSGASAPEGIRPPGDPHPCYLTLRTSVNPPRYYPRKVISSRQIGRQRVCFLQSTPYHRWHGTRQLRAW